MPAGRGSGKTELARRRVVRFLSVKKPWPDALYFYAMPTVAQAKRVAWKPLKALIPPPWIKKINESDMTIETVFGSTLYVLGMDKPQRAEGVQWDGGIVDESCDQRPDVFDITLLPAFTHRNAWCWRIGVPKRYGIGARDFKSFSEKPDVSTFTWSSEDIASEEQIAWAKRNLDPRDYNEQYRANWESASGAIFYAFHSVANVREVVYNPQEPLIIGSDFNVDPMAWVIGHRIGDELHVIDEFFLRNTNTPKTLDMLFSRYGQHQAGFMFFGDATGRARKSSASQSDYLLIKSDGRFKGAHIYYAKSNPLRADRFAATNALFCNAAGTRRCFIHPRCKHLIQDLQERSYIEGTNDADDYGDIGHITDALGYVIHRLFPIRVATGARQEVGLVNVR